MEREISSSSLNKLSNIADSSKINLRSNFFLDNFSHYTIINRGGFGIVLKALNNDISSAVKIIPFRLSKNNPKNMMALKINNKLKEVRCLENMNHPNIISFKKSWIELGNILPVILNKCNNVKDFFLDNLQDSFYSNSEDTDIIIKKDYIIINIFIEMELMQLNLRSYLNMFSKTNRESRLIINSIIEGVDYLHNHEGIIHCDLKPENILLNLSDNKVIEIKIADFGLVFEKNNISDKKFGTLLYRDPTVKNIITSSYDIYSLGIIFLEILGNYNTDMEKVKIIENKQLIPYELIIKMLDSKNQLYIENIRNQCSTLF